MQTRTSSPDSCRATTIALGACLIALGSAACEQGGAAKPASPTTATATDAATSAATATSARATARPGTTAAAAEALRAPEPKAYDAPDAAALGTLPDGVGVAVGTTAPDFELPDTHGKTVKLSELTTAGWVMLVFYRGGW